MIPRWVQARAQEQMESWLDYAVEHRKEPRFRIPQTPRLFGPKKNPIGRNKVSAEYGRPTAMKSRKPSSDAWFNTWELFKAWKADYRANHPQGDHSKERALRIFVTYEEAVPELHALLDFLELPLDEQRRFLESGGSEDAEPEVNP